MSRAAVPGLPSRHPIAAHLPALYAEDDLAQRFTAGLDTVLAPIFSTLDNLPAYFDPRLAPTDFVAWLSTWVGGADDPRWPLEQRRQAVLSAVRLHRWRGTRRGLVEALRLLLDVDAEVTGDGGATWSRTPQADPPPAPSGEVRIRVWPRHGHPVDRDRVRALVADWCPVHLAWRVDVLTEPPTAEGG